MRKILLLAFFLPSFLIAQTNEPIFRIGYFGILGTHPGIKIGIEYPLTTFGETEELNRQDQILASGNLMLYFHRGNHIGLATNLELGFRSRKFNRPNYELFGGFGYLWQIRPNKLYDFDVEEDDPVQLKRFFTQAHQLRTLGIGIGGNRSRNLEDDFWSIRPTLLHIRPFSTGTSYNFALDASYLFR